MLSETLTFAPTHDCHLTETLLCCTEVSKCSALPHQKTWLKEQPQWVRCDILSEDPSKAKGSGQFTAPYEQYLHWGNYINLIFMRDQNSPPSLNNILALRAAYCLGNKVPNADLRMILGRLPSISSTSSTPSTSSASLGKTCSSVTRWSSRMMWWRQTAPALVRIRVRQGASGPKLPTAVVVS